jgi:hypothetical protein
MSVATDKSKVPHAYRTSDDRSKLRHPNGKVSFRSA